MDDDRRALLDSLLGTPTPSGFEIEGQRRWAAYVREFADEVRADSYGNAIAVFEGGEPEIAVAGHGDEIGFMVREVTDGGYLRLVGVGGSDWTVSRGQHVTVHAEDGPVPGVVGQTAIHLREKDGEVDDIEQQHVDVGAEDEEAARDLVEVGDPVTFLTTVEDLHGSRVAARGLDNRVGVWTAAETLRRAADRDTDATVYAVSTVQEELGLQGARMVGFDLAPDAVVAVDVTHATDAPGTPPGRSTGVELGEGPVVARGSANHPELVEAVRSVAAGAGVDVQLQATGTRTGTDADAFFTARGGTPALNLGIPNR
jgi:endoglucanase